MCYLVFESTVADSGIFWVMPSSFCGKEENKESGRYVVWVIQVLLGVDSLKGNSETWTLFEILWEYHER